MRTQQEIKILALGIKEFGIIMIMLDKSGIFNCLLEIKDILEVTIVY